jgi:hypothetical protein
MWLMTNMEFDEEDPPSRYFERSEAIWAWIKDKGDKHI